MICFPIGTPTTAKHLNDNVSFQINLVQSSSTAAVSVMNFLLRIVEKSIHCPSESSVCVGDMRRWDAGIEIVPVIDIIPIRLVVNHVLVLDGCNARITTGSVRHTLEPANTTLCPSPWKETIGLTLHDGLNRWSPPLTVMIVTS